MGKPKLLIVKTGQAVPGARALGGDFEHWFERGLGPGRWALNTVRVDLGDPLPSPDDVDAVLVTGSPAMVSHREPWAERTAAWLAGAHARALPILGLCFGHQLLAHALGGRVGPNPRGRLMGRVALTKSAAEDPLLGRFPAGTGFHVSHVEVVLEPPTASKVIATAAHDPNHALHFGARSWGVQFHPEFDAAVMRAYIEARRDALIAEGQRPAALIEALNGPPTPGDRLLARFSALAGAGTCV